jgi:hypothetical protein
VAFISECAFPALVIAPCAGIYDAAKTLAAVAPDTSSTIDNGEVVSMRPYIICHMVTSIDGRLQLSRYTHLKPEKTAEKLAKAAT